MQRLASFLEWCKEQGIEWGSIQVAAVAQGGRGIIASNDVAADQLVLSVPACALLSSCTAKADARFITKLKGQDAQQSFWALPDDQQLAVYLLHLCACEHSVWSEYISTMPHQYTILAAFSAKAGQALQACSLPCLSLQSLW